MVSDPRKRLNLLRNSKLVLFIFCAAMPLLRNHMIIPAILFYRKQQANPVILQLIMNCKFCFLKIYTWRVYLYVAQKGSYPTSNFIFLKYLFKKLSITSFNVSHLHLLMPQRSAFLIKHQPIAHANTKNHYAAKFQKGC